MVTKDQEQGRESRCGACDALIAVFGQDGERVVDPMNELPRKRDNS